MYNALDSFLSSDTWYTCQLLDEKRFFQALHKIVNNPDFNADQMAEYIRHKIGVDHGDLEDEYDKTIIKLRNAAWAVRQYLDEANNRAYF